MVARSTRTLLIVLPLALLVGAAGCSDSTRPDGRLPDGTGEFTGAVDPAGGSFVLQTAEVTDPGGIPVPVALIGENLRVDGNLISLDVSIENRGNIPLYPPGEVILHDLDPTTVMPVNPDWARCPPTGGPLPNNTGCRFGYDYSNWLGNVSVLDPGETSAARTWTFRVVTSGGFSFGATVRFALEPSHARISGVVYNDVNENGVRDSGENPFGGGYVYLSGPGKSPEVRVGVPLDGRFSIPVRLPGFYTLRAEAPPTFAPVYFTTPNPLEIVLPVGPDGGPESFDRADFGIANVGLAPNILFYEGPGVPGPRAQYHLRGISLQGTRLLLDVGFSGCGPEHDFALYMVGGFMESNPVQARLMLTHDDFGELCDAYWERTLAFELMPLVARYRESYSDPVVILLRFVDWQGMQHTVQLELFGG